MLFICVKRLKKFCQNRLTQNFRNRNKSFVSKVQNMDIDSEGQENSANELRLNRSEVEEEEEIYLALHHGAGYLGAAFYNVGHGILYVMNDLPDPAPQYKLVLALLNQLNAKYLLVSSRHNEAFEQAAEDLEETAETTTTSTSIEDSTLMDINSTAGKLKELYQHLHIKVLSAKVQD